MTEEDDEARPAATVVIVRDVLGAPPELLMTERSARMRFAAGALVFPGGAVDESDFALAAAIDSGLEPDEAAARVAAIRETLEECGLGIGMTGPIDAVTLAGMRAALAEGRRLGDLAETLGIGFDLHALVPFARWHPAVRVGAKKHRIYDTRFYLVRAPEGQAPSADASETVHLFWSSAAATIARCDAGDARIIFPTRRNLERLSQFGDFDALAAHAASIAIETIRPWVEDREGVAHLCIPTHLGYPVTQEAVATALRG